MGSQHISLTLPRASLARNGRNISQMQKCSSRQSQHVCSYQRTSFVDMCRVEDGRITKDIIYSELGLEHVQTHCRPLITSLQRCVTYASWSKSAESVQVWPTLSPPGPPVFGSPGTEPFVLRDLWPAFQLTKSGYQNVSRTLFRRYDNVNRLPFS